MIAVILMVGALFPAVGSSIGELDLPKGVSELLGGADYGTLRGWMRSEIGAVYGPLVVGAAAATGASTLLAGEEASGILAIVLAHPLSRASLVFSKAAAVGIIAGVISLATMVGLTLGVAIGGGGVAVADLGALSLHLALFGCLLGSASLAAAAASGRTGPAVGFASALGILGYLINGLAPLIDGLAWLRYLSPFYYYAGGDPIANGTDLSHLAVLAVGTVSLTIFAAVAMARRDLRA